MSHIAKAYGVVRVKRNKYGRPNVSTGLRDVDTITLSKVVQNRTTVTADETLVEIELVFPDGYFDKNIPSITVTFPELPPSKITASGGFITAGGGQGFVMNGESGTWNPDELAEPLEV